MAKKHRAELHEEHPDETWLIPYADLLTLLLALFIVLYASSTVDTKKFNAMAAAFYQEIAEGGGYSYIPFLVKPSDESSPEEQDQAVTEKQDLEALQTILQNYLREQGLEAQVNTSIDDRGLVISMNDAVLFDPGYAAIKSQYRDILVKIGETIDKLPNYIRIEGHTDNVPQNSELFPTNWELSSGRATSVLRLFQDESRIDPNKLSAVAHGEWRPIDDNNTVAGRSRNRRVDVIILSSRYNILEESGAGQ